MSEKKLSERFAEALRNSDMVRMDAKTNTAIISLRIGCGEMGEVLAVLRAAEAKEDALATAAEALEISKVVLDDYRDTIWRSHLVRPPSHPRFGRLTEEGDEQIAPVDDALAKTITALATIRARSEER